MANLINKVALYDKFLIRENFMEKVFKDILRIPLIVINHENRLIWGRADNETF